MPREKRPVVFTVENFVAQDAWQNPLYAKGIPPPPYYPNDLRLTTVPQCKKLA